MWPRTVFRSTNCTSRASRASVASLVPEPSDQERISVPDAGGGRIRTIVSADCTAGNNGSGCLLNDDFGFHSRLPVNDADRYYIAGIVEGYADVIKICGRPIESLTGQNPRQIVFFFRNMVCLFCQFQCQSFPFPELSWKVQLECGFAQVVRLCFRRICGASEWAFRWGQCEYVKTVHIPFH